MVRFWKKVFELRSTWEYGTDQSRCSECLHRIRDLVIWVGWAQRRFLDLETAQTNVARQSVVLLGGYVISVLTDRPKSRPYRGNVEDQAFKEKAKGAAIS